MCSTLGSHPTSHHLAPGILTTQKLLEQELGATCACGGAKQHLREQKHAEAAPAAWIKVTAFGSDPPDSALWNVDSTGSAVQHYLLLLTLVLPPPKFKTPSLDSGLPVVEMLAVT